METLAHPSSLSNEFLEKIDITHKLNSAIKKLPPKYRAILFLRYNNLLTFKEITEISGESINTVKSKHLRAIIALKNLLKIENN